jgi:hypothetical protein
MALLSNLLSFFAGFLVAVFAEPIRKWLFRAKLSLEFTGKPACITTTYAADSNGKKVADVHTIRIRVTNERKIVASGCRGYLINLEKQNHNGEFIQTNYCDSIPLSWSYLPDKESFEGVSIPKGIYQYLNLIGTDSRSKNFIPHIMVRPFRYTNLFNEMGTFRFTARLTAANVPPQTIKLVLKWKGNWDDFEVYAEKA